MTDKDPNDMTVSELLRKAGNGYEGANGTVMMNLIDLMGLSRKIRHSECLYALADKIDAELAQARGEALRRGAELWAKANGWPDFRDGEDFGAWLERCFLPRPRYEDGEPVQSSDMEEIGTMAEYRVYMDGSWEFEPDKYEDETNPKPWDVQFGTRNNRVKRPAPEVLGADGLPIKVGETVWNTFSWHKGVVKELNAKALKVNGKSTAYVEWSNGRWSPCIRLDHLTHTPPDTQERIDADKKKENSKYWGCCFYCNNCPAEIDGKKPRERYGSLNCSIAQGMDIARRQYELDKRKGGAE